MRQSRGGDVVEYLVSWKELPLEQATWEDEQVMRGGCRRVGWWYWGRSQHHVDEDGGGHILDLSASCAKAEGNMPVIVNYC